jgi:7-cyano-7-deazaguanine synthase in queuosine biosynthesis
MKTVSIAGVAINIHNGPVGISCSGGADSSLLLYVLLKHSTSPIHVFTCASEFKNYSSVTTTTSVIKKCIELTNNKNIFHHIHYVTEQNTENLFYQNQFDNITVLYTGITANPPFEVQEQFTEPSLENQERSPVVTRTEYTQGPVYMPFTNVNKQTIAKMYTELGLTDSLYPVTRSCESTTLTQGHCGQCWWCQERNWGFGKL